MGDGQTDMASAGTRALMAKTVILLAFVAHISASLDQTDSYEYQANLGNGNQAGGRCGNDAACKKAHRQSSGSKWIDHLAQKAKRLGRKANVDGTQWLNTMAENIQKLSKRANTEGSEWFVSLMKDVKQKVDPKPAARSSRPRKENNDERISDDENNASDDEHVSDDESNDSEDSEQRAEIVTKQQLSKQSVRKLQRKLAAAGIPFAGIVQKHELVDKLCTVLPSCVLSAETAKSAHEAEDLHPEKRRGDPVASEDAVMIVSKITKLLYSKVQELELQLAQTTAQLELAQLRQQQESTQAVHELRLEMLS